MKNFQFYNPTRIIFGRDTESQAGPQALKYGKKVLLHYGGGSIKKNGVYDKVVKSLKENGIEIVELPGVMPNPRLGLVYEGIKICKEQGIDLVLAVGGGSSIDSAKAIAAGALYDGDIWTAYVDSTKPPKASLPVGVVLTIPAAGSESSTDSVITKEEGLAKLGLGNEVLIPKFAIINPETNFTLPPYQTACGCVDIMAHLMERYFTNVENVDTSDRLIEAELRTMLHYAPLAIQQPDDYDIRAEINWAGTLAHNGIMDRGRIGDWASHRIEHELSAFFDIAHGAGLAIVFPAWMKYVYKHDIDRFTQFATRVMGVDYAAAHKERTILMAIGRLEAFYKSIGMPTRLSDLDIGEDRIREMADKCAGQFGGTIGNFVKLNADDIYAIYKLAL